MARPPLAAPNDVLAALPAAAGAVVDVDSSRLVSLVDRASAIVRAYAGVTWLDDDGVLVDVPDDIPGVVIGMVERAVVNPKGAVQEATGPFSFSFGPDAHQRLYLSAMDKLVIDAAAGRSRGGLGVIPTTRGPIETGEVRLPYYCDEETW